MIVNSLIGFRETILYLEHYVVDFCWQPLKRPMLGSRVQWIGHISQDTEGDYNRTVIKSFDVNDDIYKLYDTTHLNHESFKVFKYSNPGV